MTTEEAIKVARILLTADNWCPNCQDDLLEHMRHAFPEHVATINDTAARQEELKKSLDAAIDAWQETHEGPMPTVTDVA